MLGRLAAFLRRHLLVSATALLALAAVATGHITLQNALRSADADLLMVLFALLIAVELLRDSGWLDGAVSATVRRFDHTHSFALMMLAVTGALSALVTNDVALFVVIPFTVAASRMSDFDLEDAVALEVVASNLIGCLTPLGNPQNLFVFHRSGWSASHFIATMFPFVALCSAGLVAAVFLVRGSRPLRGRAVELPRRDDVAALAGIVTLGFVLLEIGRILGAWPAAIAAAIAWLVFLRRPVDVSIVPLFFFAFIVVEGLRSFDFHLPASYWNAVAISQVISNVPATVLLAPFAHDWRTLLYGVNAGGCGTIIASLANLLGWRIYARESGRDPRFFWRLSAVNAAFLAWAGTAGWLLLR